MRLFRIISRYLVGLVFTFSGFVKCIDPLGTAYKFEDYFIAFGWDWLEWLALPGAVILCAIELCIGLMLILNIRTNWASWMALIFMAAFTPLTLVLALTNPVSDCGCFGDALILTNWQTFFKNIFIDIFVIVLFLGRNNYNELFKGKKGVYASAVLMVLIIGFELFSLRHIPIIDFRPYKIGVNIAEGMTIPEGAKQPVYEVTLIYQKDGVKKEFTIDNYPQEEGWEWVSTENKLIEKGYEPPIHDFSIILDDGDFTDIILEKDEYVFLLISHDLEKAKRNNQEKINQLATQLMGNGYDFICLTSSGQEKIQDFIAETGAPYEFGFTDQTTLKTIVRSNPGLLLIKKGTILDKWHHRHLPDPLELTERLDSSEF